MLCHPSLVSTKVSEERITSIIMVIRMGELGTLAVTSICSMLWLLVTANVVHSSLILVTPMMEMIHSSETSVPTRATWCKILEDSILHNHRHENLKSYMEVYSY
jgi:hypothetical protein